jgi:hypothetical protein
MTATVGFQLRLPAELHEALGRMAPARGRTQFVAELIRREAIRRGELRDDRQLPETRQKPRRRRS